MLVKRAALRALLPPDIPSTAAAASHTASVRPPSAVPGAPAGAQRRDTGSRTAGGRHAASAPWRSSWRCNAFLRECARTSDGAFSAGTTVLKARGLTSGEFLDWMDGAFAGDDERPLLAAHPEHYVMGTDAIGARVVENIGPHVCSFYMGGWGTDAMAWAEDADEPLPESEFPRKMSSNLFLEDGTVVGRALIQFGDTADGFTANLTVYFPTSCPKDVLDHHLRHYAVEFRNWIVAAAAARA
ncbi:hypothetical protein OHU25_39640 [Streptomyces sp. NBC_00117]|uniref:hypothetical protein n=1 Tax=Streptomyces TaxID=1883 RepID=UPI003244773C